MCGTGKWRPLDFLELADIAHPDTLLESNLVSISVWKSRRVDGRVVNSIGLERMGNSERQPASHMALQGLPVISHHRYRQGLCSPASPRSL